uniref:Nodulin-like domain-containing protein n=1 Tax=Kalanchoe fedtschenkoi TaxID=63787 RepID=A0A7N0VJ40_KALFE
MVISSSWSSSPGERQWLSLVGVIWLQSISGTNTNFPAYSSQLKDALSVSQLQLNNLAFASDAGKLFGWVSGLAAVYLPLWLVLIIGSALGLAGYGVQYLFLTHQFASLSYWQIFSLTVLAGNSICWINTVCYVVTIRNFASFSQVAVGLATSYQGLSAKIYTVIVEAVVTSAAPFNKAETYLFLNAVVPLAVTVLVAPFVGRDAASSIKKIGAGLIVMFFISASTGLYAVISSLSSILGSFSPVVKAICMGVFLLAPLEVPIAEKFRQMVSSRKWVLKTNEIKVHDVDSDVTEEQSYSSEIGLENGEGGKDMTDASGISADEVNQIDTIEEIGVSSMVKRINFWLYFFVYLFSATLGLVFANNLGQIAESRRYPKASALVSLSSSFGFFGRLLPSLVDYLLQRYKRTTSRPMSIAIFTAPISASFLLLAISSSAASLYLSTAIIGLCTGAIVSISVSTTTELFGTKHFSVNHNVLVVNIPIGSFIFGYLAAGVYRQEAKGRGGICMGMNCFCKTFLVWGALSFAATVLASFLTYRTRKFYSCK